MWTWAPNWPRLWCSTDRRSSGPGCRWTGSAGTTPISNRRSARHWCGPDARCGAVWQHCHLPQREPAVSDDRARVDALVTRLLAEHDPHGDPKEFLAGRFDLGLAWVWFPEGLGGLGVERGLQPLVEQRLTAADAPNPATFKTFRSGKVARRK